MEFRTNCLKGNGKRRAQSDTTAHSRINPLAVIVWTIVVGCLCLAGQGFLPRTAGLGAGRQAAALTAAADAEPAGTGRGLLYFQPLDLNRASLEEFTLLDGIGRVRAARIVKFRQDVGFFVSVDELDQVDGPLRASRLRAVAGCVAAK